MIMIRTFIGLDHILDGSTFDVQVWTELHEYTDTSSSRHLLSLSIIIM